MLVLTRKKSQMIQIGEDIIVKVIQTGRSTVKIGIDAPPHVRVLRGELSEELSNLKEGESLTALQSLRKNEHQLSEERKDLQEGESLSAQQSLCKNEHQLTGERKDLKEGESLSAQHSFRRTENRFPPLAAEAVVYEAV